MENENQLHLYGKIEKYDAVEDYLLVSGIASTETVDADGEVVTAEAMRKAIPSYLQSGTVREMHQPIAAGRPISAHVDDEGKTHFTAKIVDKSTIQKIKDGVLKGFSIGGKALKKVGNKITEILLKDISVVDLPNNPESFFTVIKFDKPDDACNDPKCSKHHESAVEKCSVCKSKVAKTENEKSMSEEAVKKLDALAATVDTLVKGFETLSKTQIAPKLMTSDGKELTADSIAKALADAGNLVLSTQKQLETAERSGIIQKMDAAGRVAFNPETGVAYTRKELDALDINLLKFASVNAPVIPLQARHVYNDKGDGKTQIDPNLKGAEKTAALWEKKFPSLDIVKARMQTN